MHRAAVVIPEGETLCVAGGGQGGVDLYAVVRVRQYNPGRGGCRSF